MALITPAAIIAAAMDANVLEIWTDVSGMMTADPRLSSHKPSLSRVSLMRKQWSFHFGAKVIYPPTIQPVMNSPHPYLDQKYFCPG